VIIRVPIFIFTRHNLSQQRNIRFLNKITGNRYGKTGGYLLVAPQYRLIVTATNKNRIMEVLPPPGIIQWIDRAIQGHEGSAVYVNPLGVEVLGSVIPAKELRNIFEPFYTNKSMGRSGTGLGLAIVWGAVQDHDGYIDVLVAAGETLNGIARTVFLNKRIVIIYAFF
jgi:hypothetical protein